MTVIWYIHDRFNSFGSHNPHPEYNNESEIQNCLANPDEIRQDRGTKRRRCYYRDYQIGGNNVTMKCVIELPRTNYLGRCVLVTAYNAKPNANEQIIWP